MTTEYQVRTQTTIANDTGYFSIVPEWVLEEASLRALQLYCVLARYADKGGGCYPSRKTLAERMSCSDRTVDGALVGLINIKAVTVHSQPGHSNHYILHRVKPASGGEGTLAPPAKEPSHITRTIEPESSEPPRQSLIDSSSPPPPSAQTLISAFYAAPILKKVGALLDLAKSQGIPRSGHAAALIGEFGHGGEIVDALFEAVKRARGDPWEYMRKVLQNGQAARGRNQQQDSYRRADSDGKPLSKGITAITEEEANRLLRESKAPTGAAVEGRGRAGSDTTSEAKRPLRER